MNANYIRKQFLDFFETKEHKIVPSAPIVVKNDPTLMFTNAGMNQFKDWFLGNEKPKYKRVANSQKCLRVSGKHNDLEEVGVDTYHHTMFEMLGNWSFGDYFKAEAIEWAWELLTKVYKLDKDRLYVTVFEGDEKEGLEFDSDSYNQWLRWVEPNRILKGNKKDNFWEMGDTGPCGPCSEIHIDLRPDDERKKTDGALLVNKDHPQVIELWNNVFMEFNRKADGTLEKLPAQHVDTGMGFERLVRAIEGKSSNYDTDVFIPLIMQIELKSNLTYGFTNADDETKSKELRNKDIAMRVVADHVRTIGFAIADGQLPSNNGAGYVIRRILRRAVRYQYQFLLVKQPFLCELVKVVADNFKNVFPELHQQIDIVSRIIKEEELGFLRTLENGLKRLEINLKNDTKILSGSVAFELYDTYGFPIDLTLLIARENNIDIDLAEFDKLLNEQKQRARKATEITTDDWLLVGKDIQPEFIGYDRLEAEVKIVKCRKVKAKGKELFQIVLNQTPFYPEGGGQVGDTGKLLSVNEIILVQNTIKENNLIIHFADKLPEKLNQTFTAKVDAEKRLLTQNNHSATHLLHAALRKVLGKHVAQKGSLVTADYLRFDFSHFAALSDTEILEVEKMVNQKIRENIPLHEQRNIPISDAEKLGAMMLFGEKYGEKVRVITFDSNYSIELCGGTHVKATGQIGLFKIVAETAVAAGIRRIEAITATTAENYVYELQKTNTELKQLLKSNNIIKSVEQLLAEKNDLQKRISVFEAENTKQIKLTLKNNIEVLDGVNVIATIIDIPNAEQLKNLSFELKNEIDNLFCALGATFNDKPLISLIISDNLVKYRNLHAGNLVKQAAKHIKGGGGGQPFYATAGGNDASNLYIAIDELKNLFKS
ncbi:MAG: alanine--tRNA ligase [Bacteroidia bacterium]